MISRTRVALPLLTAAVGLSIMIPLVQARDMSQDVVARYILASAKAFRAVYVKGVVEQAKKAGVKPSEDWTKDDHAIMLPAQFVKAAGAEIKDFELGLIGLTPIYKSNLPKTEAEANALKQMMVDPNKTVLTFADGNQFKGLAADFAIVQSCADCHNSHPSSPKKDFKKGDLMGAIVVRFNK
jgi:Protein of unknown function (DUF3365)